MRSSSVSQLSLFEQPSTSTPSEPRSRPAAEGAATAPKAPSAAMQRRTAGPQRGKPSLALHTLENLAARYEQEAHAPRTRAIYQSDWTQFERWCRTRAVTALPATTDTLCLYLAHMAGELGRKASTIRRARSSIGLAHAHAGLPRPDAHPRVRALERGIARIHGARAEGADPLLSHHIADLVKTFEDDPRALRDKALILLGFTGAYRASDLRTLDIDHLEFSAAGLRVLLPRSKEDQLGEGKHTDIPKGQCPATCPIEALSAWMARVGRPKGPLFPPFSGTRILHARLTTRRISLIVEHAARRAGLVGNFSAHSLRAGLATSAHAAGATEREIQLHGRWKDRRSLDRYIHVERMPNRRNVAEGLV